ncbi:MAG: hypothetical protein U1E29_17195 [Coriobacteriia bacterium]|nr:hypothetical protein [Coriobacteriia bacterium]
MDNRSSIRGWKEGPVDRAGEHFELRYGHLDPDDRPDLDEWPPIVIVGPPVGGFVPVEILGDMTAADSQEAVAAALKEVEYFLITLGHVDPWSYAKYHASSTLANFYSTVHWGYRMPELDRNIRDFSIALSGHPQFERLSFTASELRADSNWPWAYVHGVYCFVVDGKVVYVGRALGCTIGQRLWDQLRSVSDPAWAAVVESDDTRIEVFATDREWAFLGAALEVYLIDRLKPSFNLRVG